MGCFKSKKECKNNFWNFCVFLAYFEQKVAKNMFFVIFSKIVIFGQNLTLPMCSLLNPLSKNVYFYLLSWIRLKVMSNKKLDKSNV